MRYIICEEGTEPIPGRYIIPGALWTEDTELTISSNFDFDSPPIGMATDISRDKDFVWTAEIALFGREVPDECGFSIYIAPVEYHLWKGVAWCTKGLIRGVSLVQYRYWPQSKENSNGQEA